MKLGEINCPRCNSLQKFGQQTRQTGEDEFEVFIKCQKCRWEKVVLSGSSSIIHNVREIEKLKLRVIRDPSLRSVLNRKVRNNAKSLDSKQSD